MRGGEVGLGIGGALRQSAILWGRNIVRFAVLSAVFQLPLWLVIVAEKSLGGSARDSARLRASLLDRLTGGLDAGPASSPSFERGELRFPAMVENRRLRILLAVFLALGLLLLWHALFPAKDPDASSQTESEHGSASTSPDAAPECPGAGACWPRWVPPVIVKRAAAAERAVLVRHLAGDRRDRRGAGRIAHRRRLAVVGRRRVRRRRAPELHRADGEPQGGGARVRGAAPRGSHARARAHLDRALRVRKVEKGTRERDRGSRGEGGARTCPGNPVYGSVGAALRAVAASASEPYCALIAAA